MTQRPDEAILRAARALERLAYQAPIARKAIRIRAEAVSGWTTPAEAGLPRGTSELTLVEAQANQIMNLESDLESLELGLRTITATASRLESRCDQIIGRRIEAPRCDTTGRDGRETWAPESEGPCTEHPEEGRRMCAKHRKRMNTWRKGQTMAYADVEPAA